MWRENKPGLIFFSCLKEAFNSIDHTYIINCLKHFNFGEDLIKWVKLLYNDAKSLFYYDAKSLFYNDA